MNDVIDPSWNFSESIYSDLVVSRDLVYDPCQFKCSTVTIERESIEYGACSFKLNSCNVRFRVAKTTPTKIGQFVTLWKRVGDGPIQPYDVADDVDFFIVTARKDNNFGQFVFSKDVLSKYGVMSKNGSGGKRAIRVYPPWDITISDQAKKTQAWQLQYFLEIPTTKPISCARVKILYGSLHANDTNF